MSLRICCMWMRVVGVIGVDELSDRCCGNSCGRNWRHIWQYCMWHCDKYVLHASHNEMPMNRIFLNIIHWNCSVSTQIFVHNCCHNHLLSATPRRYSNIASSRWPLFERFLLISPNSLQRVATNNCACIRKSSTQKPPRRICITTLNSATSHKWLSKT